MQQTVAEIFASRGVPESVWRPIMQVESQGDPNAYTHTSQEESVGLFQLNRQGGLGTGHSVENLKNPQINAGIAVDSMAPAYAKGIAQGLSGYNLTQFVAFNAGFPTMMGVNTLSRDPVVQSYDLKLKVAYADGGAVVGTGVSTPGATGTNSTGPTMGLKNQLKSLDTMQNGTGWLDGSGQKAISVMIVLAMLGLVLAGFGIWMFGAGGKTIAIEKIVGGVTGE